MRRCSKECVAAAKLTLQEVAQVVDSIHDLEAGLNPTRCGPVLLHYVSFYILTITCVCRVRHGVLNKSAQNENVKHHQTSERLTGRTFLQYFL